MSDAVLVETGACPVCGTPRDAAVVQCRSCGEEFIRSKAPTPTYSLYTMWSVLVANFFGSLLGSGIVLAINYRRLGRPAAAFNALLGFGFASFALIPLAYFSPEEIPSAVYWLPQVIAVYAVAKGLQGDALNRHRWAGGPLASSWGAFGIGLATLPVVLVAFFAFAIGYESLAGTPGHWFDAESVAVAPDDEVYFEGEATARDARQVGTALKDAEYWEPGEEAVLISKRDGALAVSFPLREGAWNEPDVIEYYRFLGDQMPAEKLGRPLWIYLCDENWETKATLKIEEQ